MRLEIHQDEGYKMMGAAFEVYNELGYGLGEVTRQPVGYLIRFAHRDTLQWKRIILSEFIPPPRLAPMSEN